MYMIFTYYFSSESDLSKGEDDPNTNSNHPIFNLLLTKLKGYYSVNSIIW